MGTRIIGTSTMVTWPIHEQSTVSVKEAILGVLKLMREQFKNENVVVHSVIVPTKELDRLSFEERGRVITLSYLGQSYPSLKMNTMDIIFTIPFPDPT